MREEMVKSVGPMRRIMRYSGSLGPVLNALCVCALVALVSSTSPPAAAQPEPPALFSTAADARNILPAQAIAGRSRAVTVNRAQLRGARLLVNLPGDISFEAVRESQQELGDGRWSWVGHASGNPRDRVVVGISGAAVAGTFTYRGKMFKLEPRASGGHVLSQVKITEPAPELDPIPVADGAAVATPSTITTRAASSAGAVIDVLVAFTPAVRALFGSEGSDALVIQAVAETNQAYANSLMTTRLNLAGSYQVNYVESQDMGTDLARLAATKDGHMDDIHAVRNIYGADLVVLIVNDPGTCGLSYRMATMSAAFAAYAFSVVHQGCATGYYSFAHEIGHNQGAHHDYANAVGAAIFPYAYGYQDPNNLFRTIMAMNCPGDCPRIALFSRGDNPLLGLPTGNTFSASNAVAIDQTAATVADFREGGTLPPGC